jgi:hypothetical protein
MGTVLPLSAAGVAAAERILTVVAIWRDASLRE